MHLENKATSNHQHSVYVTQCRKGYVMKNSRKITTTQHLLNGFNLIEDLILWVCSLAKSEEWRTLFHHFPRK